MEEDTQNFSPTVMFRGTPCMCEYKPVTYEYTQAVFFLLLSKNMCENFFKVLRITFKNGADVF